MNRQAGVINRIVSCARIDKLAQNYFPNLGRNRTVFSSIVVRLRERIKEKESIIRGYISLTGTKTKIMDLRLIKDISCFCALGVPLQHN